MRREKPLSRRDFIARSTAAAAAAAFPMGVFAAGSDVVRVGLIGCGGRGTGAATDAANANPAMVLWAMGDAFQDRLDGSKQNLAGALGQRMRASESRCFVGFDAYKNVLKTDCDVVILTAPPGFRPVHLTAAVEAGKHIFTEKPVATDAPGIRAVMAASDMAASKKLCIVAGTQRRHDVAYRECIRRVHDGQMGEVVACYAYWNQGGLWMSPRKPEWSDMEWQMRNWLYFTWLSGDHIVEQHIHNVDVCNWAVGSHPVKAISLAGRQVRTEPAYGHIFDHFATEYEYDNGVKMLSMCRQIDGTASRVSEHLVGSKGYSNANTYIKGPRAWRWEGDRPNPYVEEHRHLYEAIASGKTINEGRQVAESNMTAIMGRMAAYTGQEISWDMALNSQENLFPAKLEFGPIEVPPVPMPGRTRFV